MKRYFYWFANGISCLHLRVLQFQKERWCGCVKCGDWRTTGWCWTVSVVVWCRKKNFVMRKVLLFFCLLCGCLLIILFPGTSLFYWIVFFQNFLIHKTFRVSDALHLQHAYKIKDFGSTMFRCWKHRNHVEHRRCDTYLKYDAFRGSEPIGS